MKPQVRLPVWRDWTLFSLKWLLLLLFSAGIYLARSEAGARDPMDGITLALAVGAVANAVLAILIMLNAHSVIEPVVAIGDILTAFFFVQLTKGDPLLIVVIASTLILSSLLRLGTIFTAVQSIGILIAVIVSLTQVQRPGGETALASGESLLPLMLLAALAIVAVVGSFALEKQVGEQAKRIIELTKGETASLQHMRQRTRAIYELSTTISSTLNYDQILSAALDAGAVALRSAASDSLASAVLLFRAEDNMLHVVASRRLTRSDDTVLVRGVEGVIGQALKEAMPIFGTSGSKDPELQYFSAFHYCRSVLCVPLRANFDNYGVLVYGTEAQHAFDAEQTELLTSIGSQACVALQNAVLYRSLLDEKERLVEVEEDARKKLARDLHDGPTQNVAAIAMRMSYIYKLVEKNPAQVPEELKKVEDLARKTAKEIRHMLFTLRPLVLESQGLSAALVQLGEKMQETHGQAVQVRMGRDVDGHLSGHQQGVLFYVIEEAVNNARKHAQASVISVQLGRQERTIICQIADNGVGFDTSIVTNNYEKRGSLGMVNMRERVELLGGSLRMESVPGTGTSITIYIPILDAQQGADGGGGAAKRPQTKLAASAMGRFQKSVQ